MPTPSSALTLVVASLLRCRAPRTSGAPGLLFVDALGELLDDLGAERRQVVGVAAGHQALVGHDLLVHPLPSGVADIGLERRVGGQRPAAHHVRLDDGPGTVADHARRLALFEEGADKADGLVAAAQVVRPHGATGYDQGFVFCYGDLREGLLDREGLTRVDVAVHGLRVAGLDTDYVNGGARLLDRLLGLGELDLLRPDRGEEDGDL